MARELTNVGKICVHPSLPGSEEKHRRPAFAISYGHLELGYVDADTFRFTPHVRWTD